MFRPTPFTPSDISRSTVARRKGGKVRYFDPQTARMSGWMPKAAQASTADIARAFAENVTEGHPAIVAAAERNRARAVTPDYARLTVKELFTLARSHYGMLVTTKTRKPELVRMLTNRDNKGF